MKTQIKLALIAATATLSLSACSGFVPASQAPRVYTAAHDTVDGDCRAVNLKATTSNTMDRVLPNNVRVVRCVSDMGGVSVK